MKIALASAPVIDREIEKNKAAMLRDIERCSGKADLVLFGESVLQGFNSLCWQYETDRQMAVSQQDDAVRELREAAKRCQIAVSFGYIEKAGEALYSSQMVAGPSGEILYHYRRVSVGWKEYKRTDAHYREGAHFGTFCFQGKKVSVALCGDLWTEGRPAEMRSLHADLVLWPVWCDFPADEWNQTVKYEYARQAALCGERVLFVNPYCATPGLTDGAAGGAAYFRGGQIVKEAPAGHSGILIVEV